MSIVHPVRRSAKGKAREQDHQFDELFFAIQKERLALTAAIMRLRDAGPKRHRVVLQVLIGLLRLQRANKRAMAVLGLSRLP